MSTEVDYSGGNTPNARYEQVKTGRTGYAELLKVLLDPQLFSYLHLLFEFFRMHNPTLHNQHLVQQGVMYNKGHILYHVQQGVTCTTRGHILYHDILSIYHNTRCDPKLLFATPICYLLGGENIIIQDVTPSVFS